MIDIFNQISKISGQAEYVVQFLDKRRYKDVISGICLPGYDNDLLTQVTAWEREIASGVNVIVEDKGQLGYELKYQFNTEQGKTTKFNAVNVGFGLTYALPVIVAILSAEKDAILFIENPESHLHPKGQAKLAELICLAAQAGVQIVVETHSEHIFNGIRKAIYQHKIEKEKIKVHYFDLIDNRTSDSKEIKFSDNGRILNYTEGLFDQFDNDLDELLGL
jgi:predicted ATPase